VTDCGTGRAHVGVDVSDVLRVALRQLPVTLESLAAEEQDGRLLVDGLPRVATDFCHRFAKRRKHFAR